MPIGPEAIETVNLLGPHVTAYAQRAVFHWRAPRDAIVSVDYGPTEALERHAAEPPLTAGSGPLAVPGPGGPEEQLVDHRVVLDGLQAGRSYFYRATLTRGGQVVAQTETLPFQTPHAVVVVRPHRIDVHRDGDRDWGTKNAGEVYFEWRFTVNPDAETSTWPLGEIEGCLPVARGIIRTDAAGTYLAEPVEIEGCLPFGAGPEDYPIPGLGKVEWSGDRTIKVKSGDTIELQVGASEFVIPDESAVASAGSAATATGPRPRPRADDEVAPLPGPRAGGVVTPPPDQPAGAPASGPYALVLLNVHGQEIDPKPDIPQAGIILPDLDRDAQEWAAHHFDLREPSADLMLAVSAADSGFRFTIWFHLELKYRQPG